MFRRSVLALAAVALLATVLVLTGGPGDPPEADADVTDLLGVALDVYNSVAGGCDSIANLAPFNKGAFGTLTGQVGFAPSLGFVGGPIAPVVLGGGAALGVGSTAGGTASAVGAMGAATTGVAAAAIAAPIAGATVALCGKVLKQQAAQNSIRLGTGDASDFVDGGGVVVDASLGLSGFSVNNGQAIGPTSAGDWTFRVQWDSSSGGVINATTTNGASNGCAIGMTVKPLCTVPFQAPDTYNGPATNGAQILDVNIACNGDPTCQGDSDSRFRVNTCLGGSCFYTATKITVSWQQLYELVTGTQWKGQKRKLQADTACKVPGGDTITVTEYSPEFWDADVTPQWLPDGCPVGRAPTSQGITRLRVGTPGVETPKTVSNWQMPSSVMSNTTSLQCWVVGATVCPIWDDGTNLRMGGQTGVSFAKSGTKGSTAWADGVQTATWPDPSTTTTVAPATTVPAVTTTSTVTSTTTVTTTTSVPPGGPGDPDPGDPAAGECFPSGWGWLNPVEWVLKPVKCALLWAFWDQGVADSITTLWDDTLGPWTSFLSGTVASLSLSSATGPCITMSGNDICTSAWLNVEMPTAVGVLFAALFVLWTFFEVVGFFARMTEST